ncbi:hypothetical protein AMTRI_Chr04g183460 [Amborella trichopoda]
MAAYRQRERDALLLQLQRERCTSSLWVMPKPRGFNGCCITAIATAASCSSLLLNIERGRSVKRERKVCEERENGRERLTLLMCQRPIKKKERASKPS